MAAMDAIELEVLWHLDRLGAHGTIPASARAVTRTVLTGALWLRGWRNDK